MIDDDLTMGENESTPAVYAKYPPIDFAPLPPPFDWMPVDDSGEPITVEWCIEKLGNSVADTEWGYLSAVYTDGPACVMLNGRVIPNVKTRYDFRELCRLLGVELK